MADRDVSVVAQGVTVIVRLKDDGTARLTTINGLGRTFPATWEAFPASAALFVKLPISISSVSDLKTALDAVPAS